MSASEKEWLRNEKESLDDEDKRLVRLYGGEYLDYVAGDSDPRAWLEHLASVVDDADDVLQAEIAFHRLTRGFGRKMVLVSGPFGWDVVTRCTRGACLCKYYDMLDRAKRC